MPARNARGHPPAHGGGARGPQGPPDACRYVNRAPFATSGGLHGRYAVFCCHAVIARAEAILLRRLKRSGRLENPRQAERFLRLRMAGLPHEELHAVWLDGQHRIIVTCRVF